MEKPEWSVDDLMRKAERYCATAEHCCYDVRIKLRQWGATPQQVEPIIVHLCKSQFIDEARYCHAFAHDKLLYQGWGRMKIQANLIAKHLPDTLIDEALHSIDEQEYARILEHLIHQRKNDSRKRLIRFCMQRGFTYEEINKHMQ